MYRVPFVNYPKQYQNLKFELDEAYFRVMSQGDFILRDDVEKFEQRMSEYLGVKYCIGLNSGTDALYFSILAHDLKNCEIITVSHTFLATVGAIVNSGNFPTLIDVGIDMNMDVIDIERNITPYTRAIIPVHLNGKFCNMDSITRIADRHNLVILEDSCQSLGASYNGKRVFGTACYSFYPAKNLGCQGDGGMVATNDKNITDKVRWLRDNGRVKGSDRVQGYGYNSRLDNLQASFLNVKMNHLKDWLDKRKKIALMYELEFKNLKQLELPIIGIDDVVQNYVIKTQKRDELKAYLNNNGIETMVSWKIPVHKQPYLNLRFSLPVTDLISSEVLSLPCYPELEVSQVGYVIETVKRFFKEN